MLKYHLKHKEHHIHHPALVIYLVTFVLLALVVLLGFISVFVPWAVKDIGVGQRAWAFPFKTCIENTFSTVNEETCIDNDFIEPNPAAAPLVQSSKECKAYVLATIAFVFLSVLPGVICLIILGYVIEHLWWAPLKTAWVAQGFLVFIFLACVVAWAMFITYMEMVCVPNSIFPISPGYSYGFIMYLFNTALSLAAIFTGFMGIRQIKVYKYVEDRFAEAERHEPGATPYCFLPPVNPVAPLSVPAPAPSPAYIVSSRPQSPYPLYA